MNDSAHLCRGFSALPILVLAGDDGLRLKVLVFPKDLTYPGLVLISRS